MSFKYRCDDTCRSHRCPAAAERIAAGWRNGRDINDQGARCRAGGLMPCQYPNCRCAEPEQHHDIGESIK